MAVVPLTLYALSLSESVGAKPNTSASGTYTGEVITNGYTCPSGVIMTGTDRGTNAGTYTATYTPDSDHEWSDGTQDTVTVTLTIARASVGARPGSSITRNYTGGTLDNGYSTPAGVSVSGSTSGITGGTYTATYTPDINHKWSDDSTSSAERTLTIQYVWQRWNSALYYSRATQPSIQEAGWNVSFPTYVTEFNTNYGFSDGFNPSNGFYNLSSSYTYNEQVSYNQGTIISGSYIITEPHSWSGTLSQVNAYYKPDSTGWYWRADTYRIYYQGSCTWYGLTSTYSKGETFYGNVGNTSNVYPSNGRHSDGYWYVKTW